MSFDYAQSAATALRLIESFGREVTLVRRSTAEASNPWEGNTGGEDERTVTGVFVSDSGLGLEVVSRLRRSPRSGEARSSVLIAASDSGFEAGDSPSLFDELKDGGDVWGISLADVLGPGDTRILYDYTLEARR